MKILFLEPHIDDFELSSSIFVDQLEPGTIIFLVTFCSGNEEDTKRRKYIRDSNMFYFNSHNVTIKEIQMDLCLDNWLTDFPMSEIIKNLKTHIDSLDYDTIMIPWEDLHPDHRMVNNIGKILGRDVPKVIEYQIQNSVYPNDCRDFNLEYVMEYEKYLDLDKKFTCQNFNPKIDILRQKHYRVHQRRLMSDGGDLIYVSDRFKVLKDTKYQGKI